MNVMFDGGCSLCLSQGWPVPVGGLQVEPEHLRIPADWTGSGTVTTGGQQSLMLNFTIPLSPPWSSYTHPVIYSNFSAHGL